VIAKPLSVYIGYDAGSAESYVVCERSLRAQSSIPIHTVPLDLVWLRSIGLYTRTHYTVGGQRYDSIDGRPFSTDFSFSRFLVPALHPEGWAVFVDQDFLFRADVAELAAQFDPEFAVMAVKHRYEPAPGTKMRGQAQEPYFRKNWSSLVAWNCDHPTTRWLIPEAVNRMSGRALHGFEWMGDHEIGALPEPWNWLDGHSDESIDPRAVHFTRGTPDMPGWESTRYADEWRAVLNGD